MVCISRTFMKLIFSIAAIIVLTTTTLAQSGRRVKEVTVPMPAPPVTETVPTPRPAEGPVVTAEKNQDYRCTDDGTLARVLDADVVTERILTAKEVDSRVVITSKPPPSYTKEARRLGIQGFVTLKVLLSADSKVSRVRIVRGLPAGLTENAIRSACKIKFKPATKDGQTVSQWVTAEYVFRLADSSIFGP
jgi:TonB family protein